MKKQNKAWDQMGDVTERARGIAHAVSLPRPIPPRATGLPDGSNFVFIDRAPLHAGRVGPMGAARGTGGWCQGELSKCEGCSSIVPFTVGRN